MRATTTLCSCTLPPFALVISFSAYGRSALALATVVVIAPASNRCAARLASSCFSWAGPPPRRGPLRGAGMVGALFLHAQREAALVELLQHLFERLRTEVRDAEQVVLGLLDQLADRADPGPLRAVARPLRQVELLDRQLEVRRRRRDRRHLTELEALRLRREVGGQADPVAQRLTRRRQGVAGRDRPVGLDLEAELVVVGRLLDSCRLDRERDPPHGREDRVDGDHADRRRALVALGREVAPALLDGEVESEAPPLVHGGEVQLGVEDLDVGRGLDVAGGDVARAALVEAQSDGLLRLASQHEVLEVQDEVGDVLLHPGDHVELVQRLVEPDLAHRGAGDRRQQRAAEAVAEGVAEAGLERGDRERLDVPLGVGGFDFWTLDDQHWGLTSSCSLGAGGGRLSWLLGVELDDQLLAHRHVDLLAEREVPHRGLEVGAGHVEPRRDGAVERVEVVAQHDHLARLLVDLDDVALAELLRRDRDAVAVHRDVPVADELAGLITTGGEVGAEHDVVDAELEHLEQNLGGDAFIPRGLLVHVLELALEEPVDAARLLLLAQLEQVLALPDAPPPVLAGRVRLALDRALHRVALGALEEQLHPLAAAELADRARVPRHQTRLRFGGRHPLWGIGVTSVIPTTSMPVFWIDRMAVSRPDPGPFTTTSTLRTPCSIARRAAVSAASCAANGVDFREPLKPTFPADAQAITFPSWSAIEMIVLLNDDLMCAVP